MRAIVLGHKGFLGRSLCKYLQREGHKYVATPLDICDFDSMLELRRFGEFDAIFNLACPTKPSDYLSRPQGTLMACSVGVNNVLALTSAMGATLVHASTIRVITETDHLSKHACYVEGKRFAETLIMAHQREYSHIQGMANMGRTCIARMHSVYGPEMDQLDTRVIPTFIRLAKSNSPIKVFGDGEQLDTFCYVDEVMSDLVQLAKGPDRHPVPVGVPVTVSIRALAELIKSLCNSKSAIEYVGEVAPPDRGGAPGSVEVLANGLRKMLEAWEEK